MKNLLKGLGVAFITVVIVVSIFSPRKGQSSSGSDCPYGKTYYMGGAYSCNSPKY
jgi:hypothetical protein